MKAECNRVDTSLGIECPEVYLALGVIAQAFEDWEARKDGASSKACFWILNCDEDVAFWCELAHISPESPRCRALSLGCHAVERYRELPDRIKRHQQIVLEGSTPYESSRATQNRVDKQRTNYHAAESTEKIRVR